MGIHPNAVLLLVLTPDDLTRKTHRGIIQKYSSDDEDEVKIGDKDYSIRVMEDDYLEGFQISASEGDIVVFDMVTYGYGAKISFNELSVQKEALEQWAKDVCQEFKCSYQIFITANYW